MPPPITFTEELGERICAAITAGTYAEVAAEACGVPIEIYRQWMSHEGRKKNIDSKKRRFARSVRKAQAQARLSAEIAMHSDSPKLWLERGPGKETDTQKGWSLPPTAKAGAAGTTINILMDPTIQAMLAAIMHVLGPHPDLKADVAKVIKELDQ